MQYSIGQVANDKGELMKDIYIRGGGKKNPAVTILVKHLEDFGHGVTRDFLEPHDVTICWGLSTDRRPALNDRVNRFNKYYALERIRTQGICCPVVYPTSEWHRAGVFPRLARKFTHKAGKDIVVCKTVAEAGRIFQRGTHDFFSEFIPTKTEYRVWVFREKVIAVYEKLFKGPGAFTGFARNHRFGFRFEKQDDLRAHPVLKGVATGAVDALNMDFGAVDILLGQDGLYYALEVNSMPAIDSSEKSNGLRLAKHFSLWAERQDE